MCHPSPLASQIRAECSTYQPKSTCPLQSNTYSQLPPDLQSQSYTTGSSNQQAVAFSTCLCYRQCPIHPQSDNNSQVSIDSDDSMDWEISSSSSSSSSSCPGYDMWVFCLGDSDTASPSPSPPGSPNASDEVFPPIDEPVFEPFESNQAVSTPLASPTFSAVSSPANHVPSEEAIPTDNEGVDAKLLAFDSASSQLLASVTSASPDSVSREGDAPSDDEVSREGDAPPVEKAPLEEEEEEGEEEEEEETPSEGESPSEGEELLEILELDPEVFMYYYAAEAGLEA